MIQCETIKPDGTQCRATARPGKTLCWRHDPELQEKGRAANAAGGSNSSNLSRAAKHIPRDMKGLSRKLMLALDDVHRGELNPRAASAMASLAGAIVRVHEIGELEQRIEALEARTQGKGWTA